MSTTPTPEELLAAWSNITRAVPAEDGDIPDAVMFGPSRDPKVPYIGMTFRYDKNRLLHVSLGSCSLAMSLSGALPAFLLDRRWVAAVSTAWHSTDLDMQGSSEAEKAYLAGDESVREAVSVTIYDAGADLFTTAAFVAATHEPLFCETYDEPRGTVDYLLSRIPAAWQRDADRNKKESA